MPKRRTEPDFDLLDSLVNRATSHAEGKSESISFSLTPKMRSTLFRAAMERGIALNAYARRATIAFAAFDTGASYLDLMSEEPRITDYSGEVQRLVTKAGREHGLWGVAGLQDAL